MFATNSNSVESELLNNNQDTFAISSTPVGLQLMQTGGSASDNSDAATVDNKHELVTQHSVQANMLEDLQNLQQLSSADESRDQNTSSGLDMLPAVWSDARMV